MGLFETWFGRRKRIATWRDLEDFLDGHAAFLVNRAFYEYARARSGVLSIDLLKEKPFQDAVEAGRWRAFPLTVGNVAELVEGRLRSAARGREAALVEAVAAAALGVMARYPLPTGFAPEFWEEARASVERRVRLAALAAPKPAQDIVHATFPEMFDCVPLHPDVRKHDFDVVKNSVRGMMLNVAERFDRQADVPALAAALPDEAAVEAPRP
jgi:hypothetical protein